MSTFLFQHSSKKFIFLVSIILSVIFIGMFSHVSAQPETQNDGAINGSDYAIVTDATPSKEDEGGVQRLKVEIKSGNYINSFFEISFKPPTENIKRDIQKDEVILVKFIKGSLDGKVQSVEVVDIYRLPNVFWAPVLFILLILVVAIAKYRRKVYIFVAVMLSIALSMIIIMYTRINPGIVFLTLFSIFFFLLLLFIYKKVQIAFVGFLITLILGIITMFLAYLTLQITGIQLSYLAVVGNFYNINNLDYSDSFYAAALISSLTGGTYIAYQQILESIKIKISEIELSKRELTLKSFRHMSKNFDTVIFPSMGFLIAIVASVFLYLQRSIGVEAALNNDYWVAFSVLASISLIVWVITVPLCALLCGMILGRLEQHKIITDKTISILD